MIAGGDGHTILPTRPLGRTGLDVTIAGLGAGGLGNFFRTMDGADAIALVAAAWDAGIRYFDTAPFYGRGRSERRLGVALDAVPGDGFVLSTKVGRLLTPAPGGAAEDGIFLNPAPFDVAYDYGYDGILRSFEASRQRIGVTKIDLLLVHDIGERFHGTAAGGHLTALRDGGLRALEELRADGAIAGYGLGVTETEACLDCLDYGDPDAFLLAGRYTLLERHDALPLLDRCQDRGVSVIVGGVFNSGILATGTVSGARYEYREASDAVMTSVAGLERLCRRFDVPLATVALQFPLRHSAVASVLLGAGTTASLGANIAGMQQAIPDELWHRLERVR